MNKFEQLIEYVINDENDKARELFHDIVVEKSRAIYEEIMAEEEKDEEAMEEADESMEESIDESAMEVSEELGGDQADDLIDDIEADEEGISMEAEGDDEDHHADVGGNEELEDRVVDLEDKLDELMAEFEALMGDEQGEGEEESEMEMDIDTPNMDAEEVIDDEMETEGMMENVNLKAAPAPVKSEDAGINKKSTVAANSGAKGAVAKPVNADAGGEEKGRTAPTAKDIMGDVQNTPAKATVKQAPATKPHLAQAAGVNTKSPLPGQ